MKHAKRRKIKNLIAILFAILLMFAVSVPCAAAESSEGNQVIRVAFPQLDGYTMTSADGEKYGLVVDFLNEIAKYTGWHYEYIDIEDSNDILTRFEAGEF